MIAYPILDLKGLRRDIDWYLRSLEDCIIQTMVDFGVNLKGFPGRRACGWATKRSPLLGFEPANG
jgi:lipoate-protein ligase B